MIVRAMFCYGTKIYYDSYCALILLTEVNLWMCCYVF